MMPAITLCQCVLDLHCCDTGGLFKRALARNGQDVYHRCRAIPISISPGARSLGHGSDTRVDTTNYARTQDLDQYDPGVP